MFESLELAIARACISRFEKLADDQSTRADLRLEIEPQREVSSAAQERSDCEEFLANGIKAFVWLERCEAAFVEGASQGIVDIEPELEALIESLYSSWLGTSSLAERWVALLGQRGLKVAGADEFRSACERVRDWLDRDAAYKASKAAREEKFAEEPW